ncbi:MAG: transposase [Nitrospiraceae bacterium]|nr:transposase [Nitrospiraceae bacterium]
MARPLRIEFDGALYHVTVRGNARKPIYKDDDDRIMFFDVLHRVIQRYNWLCYAYCLMSNHYHLVIETPDANISKGMRQLNGIYTQRFNRKYHRTGHVFQGRYKAILIDREGYLLEVCRYVVLNPVRARAVQKPEEWLWSSYRGTAGIIAPHPGLTPEWLLGQFGAKKSQAQAKYREFVKAGIGQKEIWESVQGQSILGDDEFVEKMIGLARGHQDIREIPRTQRYVGRPTLECLFGRDTRRGSKAYDAALRKAVIIHGYALKEVADHLQIHYSTVGRHIGELENARNKT